MKIFIITGNQGEGKTTLLKKVVNELKNKNISISGFWAEGYFENGERSSFDLVDIKSGNHYKLCERKERGKAGFIFDEKTVEIGNKLLDDGTNPCLYVIDEVGKMETDGKIWHDAIKKIIKNNAGILITVRKQFVEEVVKKFGFKDYKIFTLEDNPVTIASGIEKELDYLCKK